MFQIDLLKGRARPLNSKPTAVAVGALPFLLPAIVAAVLWSQYTTATIDIQVQERAAATAARQLQELEDVAAAIRTLHGNIARLDDCVSETAGVLKHKRQWSGVLVAIVESLPPNLALREIALKRDEIVTRIPEENRTTRTNRYTMTMSVISDIAAGVAPVQNFTDALRSSELLNRRAEDVRLVSNMRTRIEDREMSLYEIEMVMKSTQ